MTEMDGIATASDAPVSVSLTQRVLSRRRGRKPAEFWVSFTTLDEPYKSRSAPCRHCGATVNYHKKWEQARSHLLKCEPFLKLMQRTDPSVRPEWFTAEVEKRRRAAVRLLPIDAVARSGDGSSETGAPATTVAFRPASVGGSRSGRLKKRGMLEGTTISELLLLQTMHSGTTVNPEFISHLLAREPGGARTMQDLVDKVHQRVRRCVHDALSSPSGGPSTLIVQWSERTNMVEYQIASGAKCFFLEQSKVPDTTSNSEVAAAWLVQDTQRVAQTLHARVHHCVFQASSELVQRTVELTGQETSESSAIMIRHSPLRALFEMANAVLQDSVAASEAENPLTGMPTLALQCHDVLSLLGGAKGMPSCLADHLDTTKCVIDGVRSLSLAQAFWAIVTADVLFDLEGMRSSAAHAGLDTTTTETVLSLVGSVEFSSTLRRVRAVIEPLHSALAIAANRTVHPSDVFVAFASVRRSYRNSACLNDDQKQYLIGKIESYEELIVQDGFAQVHLLDPAYLGELLDEPERATAEHDLLDMTPSDDPNDKQALYMEYTQFQVATVQQQASGDGFVLRMLKERKKSVLQYWLTDGRQWPRLQAIVLSIEHAPADARLSNETTEVELPAGLSDRVKEVFLIKNTPLLTMSELTIVNAQQGDQGSAGGGPVVEV